MTGGYAERALISANEAWLLPDGMSFDEGAALPITYPTSYAGLVYRADLSEGETLLVHAAAGGVGSILCQWANALGVTVIGVVGNDEKAALARDNGCTHVVLQDDPAFVASVRDLAGGGVAAVIPSVGPATITTSVLRPA